MTVTLKQQIEEKLTAAFAPSVLEVVDDSYRHRNHAAMKGLEEGGETHFNVRIVSDAFAGKSRVQAQQMVYGELKAEFDAGLHALAIDARA